MVNLKGKVVLSNFCIGFYWRLWGLFFSFLRNISSKLYFIREILKVIFLKINFKVYIFEYEVR